MDDKAIFIVLLIAAAIGIWIGIGSSGIIGGSGQNPSGLLASAFAMVETNWATSNIGEFFISFDNLNVLHHEVLDNTKNVKVFDVDGYNPANLMYISTDSGLFLSRDGGLTWNRFISSNNEIDANTTVFRVVPASNNGEDYYISVFANGKGTVYRTYDYFFHLEKMVDFDNEAAYDMYKQGNYLYLAISNGQLIRLNTANKESSVVNVFSSSILKIKKTSTGFYILLKSGAIGRASSIEGEFTKLTVPGGGFFSAPNVSDIQFDTNGRMYILDNEGVYASYDGGDTFTLLKHIPIQTTEIDAIGAFGGKIYVVSKQKLYTSSDGGTNWKISDLPNSFKITSFYFVNGRTILSM